MAEELHKCIFCDGLFPMEDVVMRSIGKGYICDSCTFTAFEMLINKIISEDTAEETLMANTVRAQHGAQIDNLEILRIDAALENLIKKAQRNQIALDRARIENVVNKSTAHNLFGWFIDRLQETLLEKAHYFSVLKTEISRIIEKRTKEQT